MSERGKPSTQIKLEPRKEESQEMGGRGTSGVLSLGAGPPTVPGPWQESSDYLLSK